MLEHPARGGIHVLVLPDVKCKPTVRRQSKVIATITNSIRQQLRFPPHFIVLRQHAVTGAIVPKTAVNEYGDLCPPKDDVRATRQTVPMQAVPQAKPMKQSTE